ncbi:PREDICTED: protein Smaug homolog 1 [Nicrophorus vespilloides]|uniref:Protein Smaug homolog 1 n=1 Tax=Nicrophorus vespilloides TaxID=110193 RepID=A0ABM1MT47_NICVS|nr:PREDICTED: protein Smaug homolog 1 [Nicrophorus vespilloides]
MDYVPMRDLSEFCENLNEMRLRFHKWDSCERTVALYYLMVGLPFSNARFLQHALEQCISQVSTPETVSLEQNANDAKFVMNLLSERPQTALTMLLTHLPLLRPGKKETSDSYLVVIKKVLAELISPPFKIYNECVEIMSYVFVHPAFGKEDKKSFKQLLKQVVSKVNPDNFVHSPVNESSDESVSPNPEPVGINNQASVRLNRRSNSLTPAQTNSHENLITRQPEAEVWSSQENLSNQLISKPRSYSLSNDNTIILPQNNSLQLSSSETRLQDLQTMNNQPMMKSIVSWLKSLRLHKYSWVFNNLNYHQMLELTDESLQAIGITKGARHKLLLSIAKLKERSATLTELETEVMNGADLLNALKKLKAILQSPLQVCNGEDLSTQFVKVMGKVCTQLLMLRQPLDECLSLFSTLCERAEVCDSFTTEQKRRLALWRGQLGKGNGNHNYNGNNHYRHGGVKSHQQQQQQQQSQFPSPAAAGSGLSGSSLLLQQVYNHHKSSSYPNVQSNQVIGGHRHSIGSLMQTFHQPTTMTSFNINPPQQQQQQNHYLLQPSQNQQQQQQLAPQPPQLHHVRFQEAHSKDKILTKSHDIESSLESLCLQMMEHALGP